MTKKNILPVVVLTVICVIVAALLGVVNHFTAEQIETNKRIEEQKSLIAVLPTELGFRTVYSSKGEIPEADKSYEITDEMKSRLPGSVMNVYHDIGGSGYVVTLATTTQYSTDDMTVTVGITEGKIVGVALTGYYESRDFGQQTYPQTYVGATLDDVDSHGLVSEVTYSSKAFRALMSDALSAEKTVSVRDEDGDNGAAKPPADEEETLPRTDEEIKTLAATLMGSSADSLEDLTPEDTDKVKRVYRDKDGKGYAVYTLVISESYGTVETETIIHVGANGKIKGTSKLVWKTSDAIYGYVPPTEETVNEFYERLEGHSSLDIDSVELVSNATNTSTNLVNSIKEALSVTDALIAKDMPTPEDEVKTLAADLLGTAKDKLEDLTPDDTENVKRVYRDKGGKGYAVYAVVISKNYGTVETETLIHVGADGKIKNINKMVWKTSDAIYGYVPPTEAEVDAFYERLKGHTSLDIDSVELVSNATNTSTNLVNSIKEALSVTDALIKKDMPTPEDELKSLAADLLGTSSDKLTNVTPEDTSFVRRIFRDENGNGYAVYAVVISENYGTVETETLIHVGTDGKIKNINKMVWKTSDAIYGYVPPTKEEVDAFYGRLVGADLDGLTRIELVSNATNTSTNLIEALTEALEVANAQIKIDKKADNTMRIVGISVLSVGVAALLCAIIVPKFTRGGKKK